MKKNRNVSQQSYTERYLRFCPLSSRQPVYINRQLHQTVTKLVHLLALSGNKISVGGYIDNVPTDYLLQYKDEIEKLSKQYPPKNIF